MTNSDKSTELNKTANIHLRVTPAEKSRAVKRCHPVKLNEAILKLPQVRELFHADNPR